MKTRNTAVDLTDLAIGVLILGITVAIGSKVLQLYANSQRSNLSTLSTTNESTFINSTADTLTNQWVTGITECTANVTGAGLSTPGNTTILAANYTLTVTPVDGVGVLTNATATTFGDAKCSYNYYNTTSRADYTLANNATTGLAEFGNWFDIIVIVGIAGLILALIFMAFGNRGQDTGVSY